MYRIMIIEDDMTIASSLKESLSQWGYNVEYLVDFKNVLAGVEKFNPHLILLDIVLPSFDGYHWSKEIRKLSNVPIIFISSMSDNMNVVMAIRMGGDDFIAKPFDINLVTAKIGALLRRTYQMNFDTNIINIGNVILNLANQVIEFNDNSVELTKNEFKIVQILMESPNKIISRDTIMTRLWESDSYIDDNTLTVNITRLRKKLKEIDLEDFVITKKGSGYMVKSNE